VIKRTYHFISYQKVAKTFKTKKNCDSFFWRIWAILHSHRYAIIRRRIGWLLSQWVLQIEDSIRPQVSLSFSQTHTYHSPSLCLISYFSFCLSLFQLIVFSFSNNEKVYESIRLMLQDSDIIVRLTGAECLETCILFVLIFPPFPPSLSLSLSLSLSHFSIIWFANQIK
jgi:hypothetical protein